MHSSVTRTIRLDSDIDKAVEEQARETNVSVNSLVNHQIRKLIEWDIPAQKFGLGPVAAILLKKLFDEISEERAEELGRWNAHEFTAPFCTYLFGSLDFDTSAKLFRRASEYGGRYTFDVKTKGKDHTIILRHNGGTKVSRLYAGIMRGLYEEVLKNRFRVEYTSEYCLAHVSEP